MNSFFEFMLKVLPKGSRHIVNTQETAKTLWTEEAHLTLPRFLWLAAYLNIEWFSYIVHQQGHFLIPYRVQVLMNGLAAENLFPHDLELHIRVTGAWKHTQKWFHQPRDHRTTWGVTVACLQLYRHGYDP